MHQNETETFIYRNPQRRPDPEPLRHARHGGRGDDGGDDGNDEAGRRYACLGIGQNGQHYDS